MARGKAIDFEVPAAALRQEADRYRQVEIYDEPVALAEMSAIVEEDSQCRAVQESRRRAIRSDHRGRRRPPKARCRRVRRRRKRDRARDEPAARQDTADRRGEIRRRAGARGCPHRRPDRPDDVAVPSGNTISTAAPTSRRRSIILIDPATGRRNIGCLPPDVARQVQMRTNSTAPLRSCAPATRPTRRAQTKIAHQLRHRLAPIDFLAATSRFAPDEFGPYRHVARLSRCRW